MKPRMLNGVASLRAVSCLTIACYHISELLVANGREAPSLFSHTLGVHLFMVTSGFVLAYTARADDTPLRFIVRRLGRVVPLYWLLTAVAILLAFWRPWLFPGADLTPVGIASSFLFMPDPDAFGHIQPILFVGWTLNYLVINYVLFGLATLASARLRPLVAALLLITFMVMAHGLPHGPARTFWTDWIQLELLAGLAVGALMRDERVGAWVKSHAMWPFVAIGGLVLLILIWSGAGSALGELTKALACSLSAALVIFGLAGQDLYRTPIGRSPLTAIGDISFSVYLVHPLVIALVGAAVIHHLGPAWMESAVVIVASLGLTLVAAKTCNRLIEQPSAGWVNRRASRLPRLGARWTETHPAAPPAP